MNMDELRNLEPGPMLQVLCDQQQEPASVTVRTQGNNPFKEWQWTIGGRWHIIGRRFLDENTTLTIERISETGDASIVAHWDRYQQIALDPNADQATFVEQNPWVTEHAAPSIPLCNIIAQWAKEVEGE